VAAAAVGLLPCTRQRYDWIILVDEIQVPESRGHHRIALFRRLLLLLLVMVGHLPAKMPCLSKFLRRRQRHPHPEEGTRLSGKWTNLTQSYKEQLPEKCGTAQPRQRRRLLLRPVDTGTIRRPAAAAVGREPKATTLAGPVAGRSLVEPRRLPRAVLTERKRRHHGRRHRNDDPWSLTFWKNPSGRHHDLPTVEREPPEFPRHPSSTQQQLQQRQVPCNFRTISTTL
jgi:hypothetical protein